MHDPVALTAALIACRSVTPDDAGCMTLIERELKPHGFKTEYLDFGDTRNLYMRRGTEGPLLVFLGHTDVVPPGPVEDWKFPPLKPRSTKG